MPMRLDRTFRMFSKPHDYVLYEYIFVILLKHLSFFFILEKIFEFIANVVFFCFCFKFIVGLKLNSEVIFLCNNNRF